MLYLILLLLVALAQASAAPSTAQTSEQRVDNSTLTSASFVRRLPQALIIGAKKSGTRALLAFICMHPDVQAPGPEVHFFDRNYHRGLEWYRNRMPPSLPGQLTMEKTPGYFISESAPSRVWAMNSSTRLVLVVREPVSRMLSDYAQALANSGSSFGRRTRGRRGGRNRNRRGKRRNHGNRQRQRLPQAAVKPIESLAFRARPGSNLSSPAELEVASNWTAIRIGEYARHLANWLAVFPRRQILVLSGERLVADPGAVLEELQRFLGLEVVITRRHFYYDRRKGFHCQKKAGRGGKPRCLAGDKGRRHPQLAPDLLRRLRAFYAPKNRQFYAMAGVDFGWPEL